MTILDALGTEIRRAIGVALEFAVPAGQSCPRLAVEVYAVTSVTVPSPGSVQVSEASKAGESTSNSASGPSTHAAAALMPWLVISVMPRIGASKNAASAYGIPV